MLRDALRRQGKNPPVQILYKRGTRMQKQTIYVYWAELPNVAAVETDKSIIINQAAQLTTGADSQSPALSIQGYPA